MAEAQTAETCAYGTLRFIPQVGATPFFAWAGAQVAGTCDVPDVQRMMWWETACRFLKQLEAAHPPFAPWSDAVARIQPDSTKIDPLGMGWRALLQAIGVPDYPRQSRLTDPEALVWWTACPYLEVARLGLMLTADWLNQSYRVMLLGSLQITLLQFEAWRRIFGQMQKHLPSRAEMVVHRRLWESGIACRTLDDGRIVIGEGCRQTTINDLATTGPLDRPHRWHIPIYTVTGSIGKTTTVRLLWLLLATSGKRLALAASDGAWIGETQVASGDCIGGRAANTLLKNPSVEAAIFEQGRGGFLKQGVPYARSDIGVLLNVDAVHLGLDGIETVEEMANLKAHGLSPAKIAVLNLDDPQCERLGAHRLPESCVWFSASASAEQQRERSLRSRGTAGVERDAEGWPQAIVIWENGEPAKVLSLSEVRPYQGLLGEKTVEELLAVVCAAWFGPLPVGDWDLTKLRLDGRNHLFRTSVHKLGSTVYVLDKAGERPSLGLLRTAIADLATRESADWRIVVLSRSASEPPERHLLSVRLLYDAFDEFVCFDRPQTYTLPHALPIYAPGSIPVLLRDEAVRLNGEHGLDKPVTAVSDWAHAEQFLNDRLAKLARKTLVLINQPSTASQGLNKKIIAFVNGQPIVGSFGPE